MTTDDTAIEIWLTGRFPAEWTSAGTPTLVVDRDEITITITLDSPDLPDNTSEADRAHTISELVTDFRETTRDRRMAIAHDAEHRFERKVAWAVRVGDETALFSHLAAPVMTRLRQPERQVLDTLVAANIARSRSDALAWCVRLVGHNVDDWLADLREAMQAVDEVRAAGPDAG